MHSWGDEWFEKYGEDLYTAESEIAAELYRRTKCRLVSKEKFGTIRYEHVLVPGEYLCYSRFVIPSPFRTTVKYGDRTFTYRKNLWSWSESYLCNQWRGWGQRTLWKIIQEKVKEYPHLEDELLQDIASNEELVGEEVHKKYWRRI